MCNNLTPLHMKERQEMVCPSPLAPPRGGLAFGSQHAFASRS